MEVVFRGIAAVLNSALLTILDCGWHYEKDEPSSSQIAPIEVRINLQDMSSNMSCDLSPPISPNHGNKNTIREDGKLLEGANSSIEQL